MSSVNYEVAVASREECLEILSEPKLMEAIYVSDTIALYKHLYTTDKVYHILRIRKYSLLFTYEKRTLDTFEIHLACPKDSIRASRALSLCILHWMFGPSNLKPRALITSCPEGKIANMVKKIGGTEVKRENNLVYFMITANQFKL